MKSITLGAAAVAIALTAGACSSDTSSEGGAAVPASEQDLRERAAEIRGVSTDDIELTAWLTLEPSTCEVNEAMLLDSIDVYPLQLVDLGNGTVVDSWTDGAAQAILQTCFLDAGLTPTVEAMTETILQFDQHPGPLVMARPGTAGPLLAELGVDYEDPTLDETADGIEIAFFAMNPETTEMSRVRATLANDGTLTTDYQLL